MLSEVLGLWIVWVSIPFHLGIGDDHKALLGFFAWLSVNQGLKQRGNELVCWDWTSQSCSKKLARIVVADFHHVFIVTSVSPGILPSSRLFTNLSSVSFWFLSNSHYSSFCLFLWMSALHSFPSPFLSFVSLAQLLLISYFCEGGNWGKNQLIQNHWGNWNSCNPCPMPHAWQNLISAVFPQHSSG